MSELQDILSANKYCTLATVREGGSPWNVPITFAFDDDYIYWRSQETAIHSQNIKNDNRVSVVIYDSVQQPVPGKRGAVYINSVAEQLTGDDFEEALTIYSSRFDDPNKLGADADMYRVKIGTQDTQKTVARMLYFTGEVAA